MLYIKRNIDKFIVGRCERRGEYHAFFFPASCTRLVTTRRTVCTCIHPASRIFRIAAAAVKFCSVVCTLDEQATHRALAEHAKQDPYGAFHIPPHCPQFGTAAVATAANGGCRSTAFRAGAFRHKRMNFSLIRGTTYYLRANQEGIW